MDNYPITPLDTRPVRMPLALATGVVLVDPLRDVRQVSTMPTVSLATNATHRRAMDVAAGMARPRLYYLAGEDRLEISSTARLLYDASAAEHEMIDASSEAE